MQILYVAIEARPPLAALLTLYPLPFTLYLLSSSSELELQGRRHGPKASKLSKQTKG